jgi:uncharacterized protein YbgA (DUF1722 family)
MKKINLITGFAILNNHLQSKARFDSFFEKMKLANFNFEAESFRDSLLKSVEKIHQKEVNDSFLEFYEKLMLIVRHPAAIRRFPISKYSYKILNINSNITSTIDELEKASLQSQKEIIDADLKSIVGEHPSSYELLEVSIEELETRFEEISNFFLN